MIGQHTAVVVKFSTNQNGDIWSIPSESAKRSHKIGQVVATYYVSIFIPLMSIRHNLVFNRKFSFLIHIHHLKEVKRLLCQNSYCFQINVCQLTKYPE